MLFTLIVPFLVGIVPYYLILVLVGRPDLRRGRALFNSLALGVVFFLFINMTRQSVERAESLGLMASTAVYLVGFLLGVAGLVIFEALRRQLVIGPEDPGSHHYLPSVPITYSRPPLTLAYSMAVGLGIHGVAEGLGLGAALSQRSPAEGLLLVGAFALHKLAEGTAIAAPLAGTGSPDRKAPLFLALVGGAPFGVGALLGGRLAEALGGLFFAIAAGGLLYVGLDIAVASFFVPSPIRAVGYRRRSRSQPMVGIALGLAIMLLLDGWVHVQLPHR